MRGLALQMCIRQQVLARPQRLVEAILEVGLVVICSSDNADQLHLQQPLRNDSHATRSMKSLSTKSTSRQPRISVTAAPENRIVQDDDKTRMIASASSLMSKSAHRFRFVNSNVDGALEELVVAAGDDDEPDGCGADMRTNITLFGHK